MEKKETKVTPVKVTSTKPAAAVKEETIVKTAAKDVVAEKEVKAAVKEAVAEKEVKTAAKATEEPKKEEAKKEEAKKAVPAKKAAKKAAPKKKEVEKVEEVYVQFHDMEITTKDVLDKAKQAYVAEGHRESSIKSIRLYIKPEERMAYYVINDKFAGGVAL